MNITFVSAGAGTGKTYHLVEQILEAVASGRAKPETIVATTFSRLAARELRERIAAKFHERDLSDAALQLDEALIGTVHSICSQLLKRFALEAGISPDLRLIEDAEGARFLDQALETEISEEDQRELFRLSDQLSQKDRRTGSYDWSSAIRDLVQEARANEINPEALEAMGEESWLEMKSAFPNAVEEGSLDSAIEAELKAIHEELSTSEKSGTSKYAKYVKRLQNAVRSQAPWASWVKGPERGETPEVKFKHFKEEDVPALMNRAAEHPRLHRELESYLRLLFANAAKVGARFQELKRQRGVADYQDLERDALELIRSNQDVRDVLQEEMELLLVDEFQDTSPIQLALFQQLGELAGEVVWVGDVKQSIYAFRGADPELIFNAVEQASGRKTLDTSYRSVAELVELTNDHFAPAFHRQLKLPEADTRLEPRDGWPISEALAFHSIALHNDDVYAKSNKEKGGQPKRLDSAKKPVLIADVVEKILADPPTILDRNTLVPRPLQHSDIAVLCRTNSSAGNVAEALQNRRRDVALTAEGLLETPEARLALAALRVLTDPSDTLAVAEVVAMENATGESETWLQHRLDYLRANVEDDPKGKSWATTVDSPAVQTLVAERENSRLKLGAPLEAYDLAIAACNALERVRRWGPSEARVSARIANLEKLRGFVGDYERRVSDFGQPATLNGLFGFLQQLATDQQDRQAQTTSEDAIFVGTYHKSKGLEWPIVLLTDLEAPSRHRLFQLRSQTGVSGKRELRRWVHPFGGNSCPAIESLEGSEIGQRQIDLSRGEDLRLLYVGFTRARDHLYLLHEPAVEATWLQLLGPESVEKLCLANEIQTYVMPPGPSRPPAKLELPVSPKMESGQHYLDAVQIPSAAEPVMGAKIIGRHDFGDRLRLSGHVNERDLGDAMHRLLAAEILNPKSNDRPERADRILSAFNLLENVQPTDVLLAINAFHEFIVEQFKPTRQEVEVPFTVINAAGQRVTGFIDHFVHTKSGPLIIDHKIFPGNRAAQEAKVLSYSGQLQTYREALGDPNARMFIHLVTTGSMLEVRVGEDLTPPSQNPEPEPKQGFLDF